MFTPGNASASASGKHLSLSSTSCSPEPLAPSISLCGNSKRAQGKRTTMRQSPRLLRDTRNLAGRSDGPTATAGATTPRPPQTPRHPKSGAALDDLIQTFENKWRLGLKVRGPLWTPQKSTLENTADKVYGQIKRLFFSSRPALDSAFEQFEADAPRSAHDSRLGLLHVILKSKTQSPIPRAGTPLYEPPKSVKESQPCKCTSEIPHMTTRYAQSIG
jgi:hypothetical protein